MIVVLHGPFCGSARRGFLTIVIRCLRSRPVVLGPLIQVLPVSTPDGPDNFEPTRNDYSPDTSTSSRYHPANVLSVVIAHESELDPDHLSDRLGREVVALCRKIRSDPFDVDREISTQLHPVAKPQHPDGADVPDEIRIHVGSDLQLPTREATGQIDHGGSQIDVGLIKIVRRDVGAEAVLPAEGKERPRNAGGPTFPHRIAIGIVHNP